MKKILTILLSCIILFFTFILGWVIGYFPDGFPFKTQKVQISTHAARVIAESMKIPIPAAANDINLFMISALDSQIYLSFKLSPEEKNKFIVTLNRQADFQLESASYDSIRSAVSLNDEVEWWDVNALNSSLIECYAGYTIYIIYNPGTNILYVYRFTT